MSLAQTKVCTKCNVEKPVGDGVHFGVRRAYLPTHNDGWQAECRACVCARVRQWKLNNPDKYKATLKNSRAKLSRERKAAYQYKYASVRRKRINDRNRQRNTGWSPARVAAALEKQNGACAICNIQLTNNGKSKTTLTADHCHQTGKPRGLLCRLCNSGIGMLKDDPALLRSALGYLESHR